MPAWSRLSSTRWFGSARGRVHASIGKCATLFILQASQGLIGPEVLGVSVEAKADEITVHVCLREENEAVVDDLDDLVAEFDALQGGIVEPQVRVTIAKHLGDTDPRWPGYFHPRIFLISDRMRDS